MYVRTHNSRFSGVRLLHSFHIAAKSNDVSDDTRCICFEKCLFTIFIMSCFSSVNEVTMSSSIGGAIF